MSGTPNLDHLRQLLEHSPYDDLTLLDYALGRLPPAMTAIISLHLEDSPFDRGRLERLRADLRATANRLLPAEEPDTRSIADLLPAELLRWWQTLVSSPERLAASDLPPTPGGQSFPLPAPLQEEQLHITLRDVGRGHEFYIFTRDETIRDGLRVNGAPVPMTWTPYDLGWEGTLLIDFGTRPEFTFQTPGESSGAS